MSPLRVVSTNRALLAGLDVLTVGLIVVVAVQSIPDPVALGFALVLAAAYAAGRFLIRPDERGVEAPRGRWWPDLVWVGMLAALWIGLLATAGTPAIWLAFALMLLQMHVLGPVRGSAAVLVSTLVAIVASLELGLHSLGAVLGPMIGAALAIGTVLALETLVRESQTRQRLIEELMTTREQLAVAEHERGVQAERARLAREIHDTLAQGLTSIELLLRVAEETGDNSQIQRARTVARDNLAETRRFVRALAPADLAGSTLDDALERVVARAEGVTSRWSVTGDRRELSVDVAATFVRAAQSALANVVQHAQAQHVEVVLDYSTDTVALRITDDGVGFAVGDEGYGLRSLRARLEELGGDLRIDSTSGRGTHLVAEVEA